MTLIILAQQHNMSLEECLQCAYEEIKGRTGKMINGTLLKMKIYIIYKMYVSYPLIIYNK